MIYLEYSCINDQCTGLINRFASAATIMRQMHSTLALNWVVTEYHWIVWHVSCKTCSKLNLVTCLFLVCDLTRVSLIWNVNIQEIYYKIKLKALQCCFFKYECFWTIFQKLHVWLLPPITKEGLEMSMDNPVFEDDLNQQNNNSRDEKVVNVIKKVVSVHVYLTFHFLGKEFWLFPKQQEWRGIQHQNTILI